jgi:WS/DGAT/MGAT family acyltransferase
MLKDGEQSRGTRAIAAATHRAAAIVAEAESIVENPAHLITLAKQGLRYGASMARLIAIPPDPRTVLRGPLIAEKRVAWARPYPLDRVKAIGKREHATINDVLVSAISGGLRRYLAQRGEDVNHLTMRAMVPVNQRPLDRTVSLGNRFGLIVLDLAIRPQHPSARLRETKRRMDALKTSGEALVGMVIVGAMGLLPSRLEALGVRFFTHKTSMVLTNVVGPRTTLSLAGSPIERILFWVPQAGDIGLGISIISYRGLVSIGVMADTLRVPDPDRLVHRIEEELAALGADPE